MYIERFFVVSAVSSSHIAVDCISLGGSFEVVTLEMVRQSNIASKQGFDFAFVQEAILGNV